MHMHLVKLRMFTIKNYNSVKERSKLYTSLRTIRLHLEMMARDLRREYSDLVWDVAFRVGGGEVSTIETVSISLKVIKINTVNYTTCF